MANPRARTILPAAEATRAVPTIGATATRTSCTSSASIPLAIWDAVQDGRIDRPMRIFAPGFGAGAVGGYVVMRLDPAIVAK